MLYIEKLSVVDAFAVSLIILPYLQEGTTQQYLDTVKYHSLIKNSSFETVFTSVNISCRIKFVTKSCRNHLLNKSEVDFTMMLYC